MLDAKQEGSLAGTHTGKPGLPRGRSRLPEPDVQASQRDRLLRATVAAVAQKGYASVTVADIVRRARVSRAAFYLHFRGREECFLAATAMGGQLLSGHVVEAAAAVPDDADDEETLRAGCRAFLQFLANEPAFARVFYIDMPAAGQHAVERFQAAGVRFAEVNAKWHRKARMRHPDWPEVPDEAYQALSGATAELVKSWVGAGRTEELPQLEDTLVNLHLAVMAARPWPAASTAGAETALAGSGVSCPLFGHDPAEQVLLGDRREDGRMIGGHMAANHADDLVVAVASGDVAALASD